MNSAQNSNGQRSELWSPPDKSFTIELPVSLKPVDGSDTSSPPTYSKIETFAAENSDYAFLVQVLELGKTSRNLSFEEKLKGLQFVIGGDDDREFLETYLRIDNLPAKQIDYKNQNNKGLMIVAGDRIYVLALGTKNRKDLSSQIANRFFRSFHILKNCK